MSSSRLKKSLPAYPKAGENRKGERALWPAGRDTAAEVALKQRLSAEGLSSGAVQEFQALVYGFYAEHGRQLPWREGNDPYRVLVSEVMLQQTQVERVAPRFNPFLERFPGPQALAGASLPELLAAWQGLGYNRRALNLQRAARVIAETWQGGIPDDPLLLRQLPGIGPYTAGAIAAFAFDRPEVFLETNIRAVLLHLFFGDRQGVSDRELLAAAEQVLDQAHPRRWYNALMDYGSDLKRRFPNPSRRSRSHTVQGRFEGSDRQVRGAVLRLLLEHGALTAVAMAKEMFVEPERLQRILAGMQQEGFLKKAGPRFSIP